MKHHFTLLLLFTALTTYGQQYIKINNTGQLKLLGSFDKELLSEAPFAEWFSPNYDTFNIEKSELQLLSSKISNVDSIQIFLGTWCGDSKREVPRFLKIMDELNFENITLIGLDHTFQNYKQSPFGEEAGLNIHRVPTFIFYKDSIEINRIVESPKTSLTADINALLDNQYSPNYEIVTALNKLFKTSGYNHVNSQIDSIAGEWQGKVENQFVLNTYGYKLFTSFQLPEAEAVFQLNCLLFPQECRPFLTMGRYYLRVGDMELARLQFEKGLEIDKNNEELLTALNSI
ncbi:TlpA family protein disulfide reductase [Fulvivirga lutea]|uniref:Thioredoxin n=1 Tax=Fulvivirga lutea TaxID=2810512 RepID=A0A975A1I2_9BACT|nr:thioredoxin family protein [Fulvivirga lutea]QSE98275.1 hypothetical protein JR347_04125 [Fulvivirga lutea]